MSNFLLFFVGHLNKGICLIHFKVIPQLMESRHEFPDFPLYQISTFNLFFLPLQSEARGTVFLAD